MIQAKFNLTKQDLNYSNTIERFFPDGKEYITTYNPSSMTLYGLSKSLIYGNFFDEEGEIYKRFIFKKLEYVVQNLESSKLSKKLPTKKELKENLSENNRKKSLIYCNLEFLVRTAYSQIENKFSENNSALNSQLLYRSLENKIIFNTKKIDLALTDLMEIDNTMKMLQQGNSLQYSEFERKYVNQINKFSKNKIKGHDEDDLKQEAKLVFYSCMKNYTGKKFSRFSSYLKKSLEFKFKNLLRYSYADVRKIHKFTVNFSSLDPESCIVAHRINQHTHEFNSNPIELENLPSQQDIFEDNQIFHFRSKEMEGYTYKCWSDYKEEYGSFPHFNEEKVEFYKDEIKV